MHWRSVERRHGLPLVATPIISSVAIIATGTPADHVVEICVAAAGKALLSLSKDGAGIGDRDTLTVTVRGSTAVPTLPLIGQLLLGLFMMAGGARLHRWRWR